jgi:hypothetical protein
MRNVSHSAVMQKILAFLLGAFWTTRFVFGAEPTPPIKSIAPEDIVQDSIKLLQMGTNKSTVFFTYTDLGAKKMLAFSEEHAGQKTRTRVGEYLGPEGICYRPPDPVEYAKWKEGWLKRRTSKIVGVSEIDAKAILAGLKGEPRK